MRIDHLAQRDADVAARSRLRLRVGAWRILLAGPCADSRATPRTGAVA